MLETFRNAWKIEDLRKRLLFTLLILVLFRLGCAIPVPYISAGALTSMFAGGTGDMLEYLNMMSGGALSECTLFALGVQPAINASIIMQLLAVAIPYLENLTKEGEEGQRKMRRITNYVGAGIGLMLSSATTSSSAIWALCLTLRALRASSARSSSCWPSRQALSSAPGWATRSTARVSATVSR